MRGCGVPNNFKARNLVPGGRGRDGGAQTSRGALTVQKARMLHRYQLQLTFTNDFITLKLKVTTRN